MIRGILRLAIAGAAAAWLADRLLGSLATDTPASPMRLVVVIDAPVERAWQMVSDIEGQPRWMHDMKSVRVLTPGPTRVGSRGEATVRIFGVSVTDPVTVTALEPPTRFAITHDGAFAGGGTFTLEAGAEGTTTIVRWDETLVAPVLPHLAAVVMAPLFRFVFQRDLERLKELVETGAVGA